MPDETNLRRERQLLLAARLSRRLRRGGDEPSQTPAATVAGFDPRQTSTAMLQAIAVTDARARWAVYVPLRFGGKIVVPDTVAH